MILIQVVEMPKIIDIQSEPGVKHPRHCILEKVTWYSLPFQERYRRSKRHQMAASASSSLIFHLEVEDDAAHGASHHNADAHQVLQRLGLLMMASCPFALVLREDVQVLFEIFGQDEVDVHGLAAHLTSMGYQVCIRVALPGRGVECFQYFGHDFLVVRGTGEFAGMEFIVEPFLRRHFTIPNPSYEYAFVLCRTPDVFVGGSCRLVSVVQLLCSLMAASFQHQGLPLPPWRKEAAMLSKWLPSPSRLHDTPVTLSANTPPRVTATAPRNIFAGHLNADAIADTNNAASSIATIGGWRADSINSSDSDSDSVNTSGGIPEVVEGDSVRTVFWSLEMESLPPPSPPLLGDMEFTTAAPFVVQRGFSPVNVDMRPMPMIPSAYMASREPLMPPPTLRPAPKGLLSTLFEQQQERSCQRPQRQQQVMQQQPQQQVTQEQLQQRTSPQDLISAATAASGVEMRVPVNQGEMAIRVGFVVRKPAQTLPQLRMGPIAAAAITTAIPQGRLGNS